MTRDAELRRRFGDLTPADIAALDAAAVRSGVTVVQLMEVAGWQVARCAWRLLSRRPGDVAVVAGRGNNGGDGAVAARHLSAWGCRVALVLVGDEQTVRGPLADHLVSARASGVHVVGGEGDTVKQAVRSASLVLDALLGTGLRGAPRDADAAAITAMDHALVLAVDVPSGLDAGSGQPHATCVRARATCSLTGMKRGLWQPSGRVMAGTLYAADIGMPPPAWREAGLERPAALVGGALLRVAVD